MQHTFTVTFEQSHVTKALLNTFLRQYTLLEARIVSTNSIEFSQEKLSDFEKESLLLDIRFYDQNPTLPLENLCSHLHNYNPKNESQDQMLEYARRLVALEDESMGAGLYMYGAAGIGKSHIAVGISKHFMRKGLRPNFQFADRYSFSTNLNLEPGQVWIIDDMNSGFSIASQLFKKVVLNAHERGGRVFVTSNKEYNELMKEMFVGDSKANLIRYEDRTKGMFKILEVNGDSFRQENAWYK